MKKIVSFNRSSYWKFFGVVFSLLLFVFLQADSSKLCAAVKLENVLEGQAAYPWARVECLNDSNRNLKSEPFHLKNRRNHSVTKAAFGTNKPSSNLVLLHFAPDWNKNLKKTPIILVHGAGDNATRGFAHPWSFEIPENGKIDKPGLMQYLAKMGYPVFAVTFSHPQGDNFIQAHQLSIAINRVKQVTKSKKVDLVCHSKGAMSVRIYTSDLGKDYPEYSWINSYKKDVRKIVFLASPLKGIDTQFRYYAYNFTVMQQGLPAPMGCRKIFWMGIYTDCVKHNYLFPGQSQMLHNWVKDGIPFSSQSYTPDMNLSMNTLYNGGVTALVVSDGIDQTIKEAGSVIDKLNEKGVSPEIKCYILAGKNQTIDTIKFGWLKIPVGEFADESDGILFLKSATYSEGLKARGAKVEKVKVINHHHVGVSCRPEALEFVNEALCD